jgi:RING finger/CHY zinc finger protein 1
MPEEYKDFKMLIMCNDCLQRSEVNFHIMGGKCKNCKSYNTSRINNDESERKIMEIQNKMNELSLVKK